jgi:dolichol-phosphate mannosyltransferase
LGSIDALADAEESILMDGNTDSRAVVDLTVFIPSYLEGENLKTLLPEIKSACGALTANYEVLIIDTQTDMDDTGAVCRANGVRHIHRYGGNQYGDAIRTAIAEAQGQYVLCMDADGSHSPSYFAGLWAEREKNDITIGSRYAAGGHTENPAVLIWMSYVVNLTFRVVFSIKAKDVTNSFRLYKRSLLTPMKLESDDFDILEEILIKAVIRRPPAVIGEVPMTFARRKAGESKRDLVKFAFGYLKTLRRLRTFAKSARKELK